MSNTHTHTPLSQISTIRIPCSIHSPSPGRPDFANFVRDKGVSGITGQVLVYFVKLPFILQSQSPTTTTITTTTTTPPSRYCSHFSFLFYFLFYPPIPVSFSETSSLIHLFGKPFTSESGVKIFQSSTFDQTKTNVKTLIEKSFSHHCLQSSCPKIHFIYHISTNALQY